MAFEVGLITIWDDAVAIHQPDVLVAAKAVPLANQQGVFWNAMSGPAVGITGKKFEIYARSLTSMNGTIGNGAGTGWTSASVTVDLPMTSTAINLLTVGCVLLVESEVVIVKAIDTAANTIDVWSRGAGGTSGATHADTTAYAVIQYAAHDTDLKNVNSRAETTLKYTNYCQTLFETIDYTKSQELIGRTGIGTGAANITILKQEAMNRVAQILSIACLRGVKQVGTAAGDPYASAGLFSQLEDTVSGTRTILQYNASSAAFSETILKLALKAAFVKGNPDTILLSPGYKKIADTFNQAIINTNRQDRGAGSHIESYNYQGKEMKLMVDQDSPDTKVGILTMAKCQKGWQSGDVLRYADEPKGSSRENRGSLQGSVGLAIEGVGYDHLEIYGLASGA